GGRPVGPSVNSACRENNRSIRWNRPISLVCSHCIKVALPIELASKPANLVLLSKTHDGSKSKLHCLALGLQTRESEGLLHQLVVNDDIGPHDVYSSHDLYTL